MQMLLELFWNLLKEFIKKISAETHLVFLHLFFLKLVADCSEICTLHLIYITWDINQLNIQHCKALKIMMDEMKWIVDIKWYSFVVFVTFYSVSSNLKHLQEWDDDRIVFPKTPFLFTNLNIIWYFPLIFIFSREMRC